jgi:hypothetical protein
MNTQTERKLLDRFDEKAFTDHMRHDDKNETQPETCDFCFTQPMLAEIAEIFWSKTPNVVALDLFFSMQDGYGEVGYGDDWSGIRDSTPQTIREIWKAMHA